MEKLRNVQMTSIMEFYFFENEKGNEVTIKREWF